MSSIWRRRPSPAMVVACTALLLALGGTSYATVLNVPRNSVGTLELRNNAVTSAKVRNGSLMRADFRAGQVPAGPAGPAGPQGAQGPGGPAGAAGPSDAYAASVGGPIAVSTSSRTFATLNVPQAGRYILWAKAVAVSDDTTSVTCTLFVGNDQYDESTTLATRNIRGTLALLAPREFAVPGTADVRCLGPFAASVVNIRIAAIRVGNLTATG
jgi:hypothetical protein